MPELAFELEEIFRTRLFSFPLDDHESAREIFRYLLDRGVPEDELAHVIQASTNSMTLWLCRTGLKKMVGEWIISWINKCYNQYLLKEASVRVRSKSAKDCHQCFKENCLPQKDEERRPGMSGGRTLNQHSRSLSEPEVTSDSDVTILPFEFDLNKGSDNLKLFQDGGAKHLHHSPPQVYFHLMCKNFLSLLRRGSDIVISLNKVQTPSALEELARSEVLLGPSYSRCNSFPSDRKWKHLKLKAEFSKLRAEKRDSGIVEDIESCLSEAT